MLSRLEKLARLGIEPDALAVLEAYGKTLPRDIKLLDEEALAEMKLRGNQLGKLNARRLDTIIALEVGKEPAKPKTNRKAKAQK